MLFLGRFELQEGENSYTDLKLIQSDSEELAGFAADEYLQNYFDEDTEILSDGWAIHKCGYPAVKLKGFEEIRDFAHLIERVGYIGEKPQMDKPEVIIGVRGGVAEIDAKPAGVRVAIRDYDCGEHDESCPIDCTEHEYSEFVAESTEVYEEGE